MRSANTAIALLAITLLSTLGAEAQQSKSFVAAPVPPQIASAKKVFISNYGTDIDSSYLFNSLGDPDRTYNQFYARFKGWGRYELVASPSDADLVFEIQFAKPTVASSTPSAEPHFALRIVDARTRFTLWALVVPVEIANRKPTWEKNFNQGMDDLMEAVKKISGESSGPQATPK